MTTKQRQAIPIIATILTLSTILLPASVLGQATPGVTGAGAGTFPGGASYSGVSLNALQFGMGVDIPGDGSAAGQLQTMLLGTTTLGQPQNIEVDGEATNGANNADGSRTFSGTATVDLGNGTPPLTGVPFTLTATPTSLLLVLGATTLPAASVTDGVVSVR